MKRAPKNAYLPLTMTGDMGRIALEEYIRQVAEVTREIQAPPICVVDLNGSDQSIGGGATTNLVNFITGSASSIDTHGWWNNSTYRYVPKESGYYLATAHIGLADATNGMAPYGNIRVRLRKNGANEANDQLNAGVATSLNQTFQVTKILRLDGSTDYVDFAVTTTGGSTLSVLGGTAQSGASITFLGSDQLR